MSPLLESLGRRTTNDKFQQKKKKKPTRNHYREPPLPAIATPTALF